MSSIYNHFTQFRFFIRCGIFMVAALITKGSDLIIKDVGINPMRTGLLDVLDRMGAKMVKRKA